MKNINWGIIGCGKVVQTKSGPAFNSVPDSSIFAVCRRDATSAQICADALGAKKFYTDYKDLITDENVNAVYLASPPGLHYEQALYCAKNKKPTYVEKPFARNFLECKKIVDEFQKEGVPLYVAHYRRALPKFLKLKELLGSDIIGDLYTFECNLNRIFEDDEKHDWMFIPRLSGGGKFFDIAPHMVDILIFLFGRVSQVSAYCKNINKTHSLEEIVVAIVEMENNLLGTLNFNLSTDSKKDQIVVRGGHGEIAFSIHGSSPIVISKNNKIVEEIFIETPEYIQEPMIKCVVDDLINHNPSVCYGVDALETYRVIDIILNDYYNGRDRDFWLDYRG